MSTCKALKSRRADVRTLATEHVTLYFTWCQSIKGIKGKSYQQILQQLKLWSLEERRNRQDLIEVFKICKGFSRIRPKELFIFQ